MPGASEWRRGKRPAQPKPVFTVDWHTLVKIRQDFSRSDSDGGERSPPLATADELAHSWLRIAARERQESGRGSLSIRDQQMIELRVCKTMREVQTNCIGSVDVDAWLHHMLLRHASPLVARTMLQINRLLSAAIQKCPGILVGLQHALEVARPPGPDPEASDFGRGRCCQALGLQHHLSGRSCLSS